MNLYLIHQSSNNRRYDIFRDAVVVAENEESAKLIHPDISYYWNGKKWLYKNNDKDTHDSSWVEPSEVHARHIGTALPEFESGDVINYSFKAG